ncbi:hypothetical protein PV325_006330 [Microctonus aethiopoides]|nr:hypothetical protein PV325_006330 [Microctonus aethiopoides]
MALVKNMMKIILLVLVITTITGAYTVNEKKFCSLSYETGDNATPAITCPVYFSMNKQLDATTSQEVKVNEPFPPQYVINFTEYASSFEEFAEKFPTFTLVVNGTAYSDSTFGDAAQNKFGSLTFSTYCFDVNSRGYYANIVDVTAEKSSTYYAIVNIKIGFKKRVNNLYVLPYVRATLRSQGIYMRSLSTSLYIETIIFNPKI